MYPTGCASAALVISGTLTGSFTGTYFRNPTTTSSNMSPECGTQLCTTNTACKYGCFCVMNGATLSVVGFYYAATCGGTSPNYANGTTVVVSGIVTDAWGEIATASTGAVTCVLGQSPPPTPPPSPPLPPAPPGGFLSPPPPLPPSPPATSPPTITTAP